MAGTSAPYPLEEPGLWVERVGDKAVPDGGSALFLDRDGTINIDTGYPSDPGQIVLRDAILPVIQAANQAGWPVVIVTNQSGIARGYFGWDVFAAVNGRILTLLREKGCFVDMVLACAYHEAGKGVLRLGDHPMRKPNPGMLLKAAEMLRADLRGSVMVGDKEADIEAGRRAGLSRLFLAGQASAAAEQAATAEIRTISGI
ncbi:D-glycero-beta-D-manno-heptose-1,7-bisphosphate 7-phosphatase [Mycolicibacterium aubagnense]